MSEEEPPTPPSPAAGGGNRHARALGRRRLTAEEEHLWSIVARSVKPLLQKRQKKHLPTKRSRATSPRLPAKQAPPPAAVAAAPAVPVARPSAPGAAHRSAPIALRDKQRLARGRADIDARIDLHGMTQAQAHAALLRFLHHAQAEGARFVLVITGKGAPATATGPGTARGERGVLRRQVPLWLGLPEFRSCVLGFDGAHIGHGGEGALYVRLRRAGR
jgi:DNA-nicking Smr family endonuclease